MSEENLIKAMEYGAYIKKALSIAVNVGCGFEGDAEDAAKLLSLITYHESRIAELEAVQRWIPVSERLPELNKVVAVIDMSDKDGHLCNVYETAILVEVRGDTRFGFIGHSGWDSSDVTHWMPLPKLPEVTG